MFVMTCSVCSSMVSPANFIVSAFNPIWPLTYSVFPARIACEYGPSAAGDLSVATTWACWRRAPQGERAGAAERCEARSAGATRAAAPMVAETADTVMGASVAE